MRLPQCTIIQFFNDVIIERIALSIFSIMVASRSDHFYKFYAVSVSNHTRPAVFSRIQKRYFKNCEIVFLCHPFTLPLSHEHTERYSVATFGKFFIPAIVSEPTVLYLDADVLANGDISLHFSLPLDPTIYFYASLCYNLPSASLQEYLHRRHFDHDFYYNAGLLYFNVDAIRDVSFTEIGLTTWISHANDAFSYPDQDVLNLLYHRDHVRLFPDFRYNCQPDHMHDLECILIHNHNPPNFEVIKAEFTRIFQYELTCTSL
jgi:lipopolysaccharide biosynthesis glycosyltransferase